MSAANSAAASVKRRKIAVLGSRSVGTCSTLRLFRFPWADWILFSSVILSLALYSFETLSRELIPSRVTFVFPRTMVCGMNRQVVVSETVHRGVLRCSR